MAAVTGFTREAQRLLRDPHQFKWYVVTLLVFVFYVYAVEVERRRWDIVLAGLAFWLMDWLNEIVNALVLHLHRPGGDLDGHRRHGLPDPHRPHDRDRRCCSPSSGVIFVKFLPADRNLRILGMPNRLGYVLGFSCLCVFVEVLLHDDRCLPLGVLVVERPVRPADRDLRLRDVLRRRRLGLRHGHNHRRQLKVVGTLAAIDVTAILVFGVILGWI